MADPRSWFLITAKNDVASAIINDTRNRERVCPTIGGIKMIRVNFDDYFKPDCVLSFGRDRSCSIVCDAPEFPELSMKFSRRQCQFFLQNSSLLIRDDSSSCTTNLRPEQDDSMIWKFPSTSCGNPRQRAIPETGVWDLDIGPAEFCLHFASSDKWWHKNIDEKKFFANRKIPIEYTLTIPTESLPPTRYQTRVQTPRIPQDKARNLVTYYELEYLGRGSFGRVNRVLDLQWGGIMAVKIICIPQEKEKESKETLKREVELLARLSHPHIIDYKHSQGWEWGKPIEIFMSAADGSLRGYLDEKRSEHKKLNKKQIELVSEHVLSALYYLYGKKIIHRDIKPENILYKDIYMNPIFLLADFGYSKEIDYNATFVGTPIYWAPEICLSAQQDFRVDIWSFGVVIYEMLTGLALDQVPGLTNNICASGEWCKWLEDACFEGHDLARMLTFNAETRITIEECCASPKFPILPDTLPQPSRKALTQTPTTLIPRTQLRPQINRQNKKNILGVASPRRIEKARNLRGALVPRR